MFAATARALCSGRIALIDARCHVSPTRTIDTGSLSQTNNPHGCFGVTGVWDRSGESYVLSNDRGRRSGHMQALTNRGRLAQLLLR